MAATKNNSSSSSTSGSRGASAAGAVRGEALLGWWSCSCWHLHQQQLRRRRRRCLFPASIPGHLPVPSLQSSLAEAFLEDVYGNMSRHGKSPKLDLRLNLSAPRGGPSGVAGGSAGNNRNRNHNHNHNNNSPHHSSSSSSPTSPPSSCVSSETEQGRCGSSPEATSMVLVGCPRCLMYVMLSEDDPKCPKCKSTVLLDFLNDPKNAPATSTKARKK